MVKISQLFCVFSIKSYIKQLRQGGLPGEDFKELGRDIDEAIEAVKILQEAGYDAFDADAGTYDSWLLGSSTNVFEKGMYLPLVRKNFVMLQKYHY